VDQEYQNEVNELLEKVKHYTDAQLANAVGVTTAVVSRWRNKKTLPYESNFENLRRLGLGLKVLKEKEVDEVELEYLINEIGGVTKVAKLLQKSNQLIYQWRWGKSKPSIIDYRRMKFAVKQKNEGL